MRTSTPGPATGAFWNVTGTPPAASSIGPASTATPTATATSSTSRDRRKGTKNQGWKDSGDAIVYDDGAPVPAPIATCELQGYWYIAQELMGLLSNVMNSRGDAARTAASGGGVEAAFQW